MKPHPRILVILEPHPDAQGLLKSAKTLLANSLADYYVEQARAEVLAERQTTVADAGPDRAATLSKENGSL